MPRDHVRVNRKTGQVEVWAWPCVGKPTWRQPLAEELQDALEQLRSRPCHTPGHPGDE